MKIEMGESLLYSYLKHVKRCLVTQLNWKTSGKWTYNDNHYDEIKSQFFENNRKGLFAGIFNINFSQTLRQAEIDLVGISNNKVYAVEVAYHDHGLRYGGDAVNRVTKKLLRAYYILKLYFPNCEYEILFVSPRVSYKIDNEIKENVINLNNLYVDGNFKYYANSLFNSEILKPTINNTETEADTSELFVRALRLSNLFESDKFKIKASKVTDKLDSTQITNEIEKVERVVVNWFRKPHQINSSILLNYFELYQENKDVLLSDLKIKCAEINNLSNHLYNMVNIKKQNHGKVFEIKGDYIYLWEPVKDFIIDSYRSS